MPARPHALLIVLLTVLCGGCVSAPSGKHWWSPKTWFSSAPAAQVQKVQASEEYLQKVLLIDAQGEVEKTVKVLQLAPKSEATLVALGTSSNASKLMTQALGSLPFEELMKFDKWSNSVLFGDEVAKIEAKAQQAKLERKFVVDSAEYKAVQKKLDEANARLLVGFAKENALADTLRNERAMKMWILGGGTLLLLIVGGGCLYLQIATGGIPKAIGGLLKGLDERDPEKANLVRSLLDPVTNRIEQALIRKHT